MRASSVTEAGTWRGDTRVPYRRMGVLDGWRYCPRCAQSLRHEDGRLECVACGFEWFANPAPAVAALVADDEGRLLLARRAVEPGRGLWDTPGGFLEEREDPLRALRRELHEETGVGLSVGDFVGAFVDTYGTEPDSPAVLNLVWEATIEDGDLQPADDVSELRWFAAEELPRDEELAFPWIAPVLRAWARRQQS